MKMTKLAVLSAAALMFGASAFADTSVDFYNKVSSGIVSIDTNSEEDGGEGTSFAGISEKIDLDVKTDRVDVAVTAVTKLQSEKYKDGSDEKTAVTLSDYNVDWDVEFRPIDMLTVGFSNEIYGDASYMLSQDDNTEEGNIGNDFVLVLRPIDELRLSAGIDLATVLFKEEDSLPTLNFGADFTNDDFSAEVSVRNVGSDDCNVAVFGKVTAVDGWTFTTGYSQKGFSLLGFTNKSEEPTTAPSIYASAFNTNLVDNTVMGLDFAYQFNGTDTDAEKAIQDLYLGFYVDSGITDMVHLGAWGFWRFDVNSDAETTYALLNPFVDFYIGDHNKIEAGVQFAIPEGRSTTISFPVYWKWTL